MTQPELDIRTAEDRATAFRERQDGDYAAPILAEPKGGPIPKFQPPDDAAPAAEQQTKPTK
jgi:hypothetical protein